MQPLKDMVSFCFPCRAVKNKVEVIIKVLIAHPGMILRVTLPGEKVQFAGYQFVVAAGGDQQRRMQLFKMKFGDAGKCFYDYSSRFGDGIFIVQLFLLMIGQSVGDYPLPVGEGYKACFLTKRQEEY